MVLRARPYPLHVKLSATVWRRPHEKPRCRFRATPSGNVYVSRPPSTRTVAAPRLTPASPGCHSWLRQLPDRRIQLWQLQGGKLLLRRHESLRQVSVDDVNLHGPHLYSPASHRDTSVASIWQSQAKRTCLMPRRSRICLHSFPVTARVNQNLCRMHTHVFVTESDEGDSAALHFALF
jgi:hypothetical protein